MAKAIENLILEEIENGKRNKRLTEEILARIEQHTADYSAGYAYAEELGGIYAYSIRKWLEQEYRENGTLPEALDGLIVPPLRDMHARLTDVTARIQESFNQEDGIGLSAVKPPFNAEMAQHLSDKCVSVAKEKGIDEAGKFISEPIKTFALKTVDDTLKQNADFQANAGIERKYRRICIGAKPCQWCRSLAGTYIYGQEPEEFFHRHQHCRCSIEPLHGRMRKRQKFKWEKKENDVILEARKPTAISYGLPHKLAEQPIMLAKYTPDTLKSTLEQEGWNVTALSEGKYKGVLYEDGGGYKVNFEDGGLLQYHPKKGSHHEGAYYKISTGKKGTRRFNLDGTEQKK